MDGALCRPDFWQENLESLKASAHCERAPSCCTDQTMATSQPSKMQVEGEVDVSKAVKPIVGLDVEEKEDPFEGLTNAQIAEIYHKMKPEDCRLFRQFKSFHKLYFELHGHDAASYHLARGIV